MRVTSGRWTFVLVALIAVVFLTGCPRRPMGITATAPAPSVRVEVTEGAPVSAAAPGPVVAAPAPVVAAPTAPVPAPPQDYAATDLLKPIFFDFDKSDIRPGDAGILDANAERLKSNPKVLVLVEGHCDERGTNEYNIALGDRRAHAAVAYLVSRGIDAKRFTTISYGEERPTCSEQTEACWAKNRRGQFLTKDQ
jgi:peptidoglycan-associated lipoprotein